MLNPDFSDRTYTAEVIRLKSASTDALQIISDLTHGPRKTLSEKDLGVPDLKVVHAFVPSKREYHRVEKTIIADDGKRITIPRRIGSARVQSFLYDVLIAQLGRHLVVAVPFHELAEKFFVRVDDALAGTGLRYERLDITALVIELGSGGIVVLPKQAQGELRALSVTRCHLNYSDRERRNRDLQQIRMTGANLGATKEYQGLIAPVLEDNQGKNKDKREDNESDEEDKFLVTPVVLGFALSAGGVRKSSAITDRHGNFKLWISPGIRRFIRVFGLIRALEDVKNVTSTTTNVPILQSGLIREAEA